MLSGWRALTWPCTGAQGNARDYTDLHDIHTTCPASCRATFLKNLNGYRLQVRGAPETPFTHSRHKFHAATPAPTAPVNTGLDSNGRAEVGAPEGALPAPCAGSLLPAHAPLPLAQAIMAALREQQLLLPEFDGR